MSENPSLCDLDEAFRGIFPRGADLRETKGG